MKKFWDRFLSGFRRSMKAPEGPLRRSPWVLVAHVSPDPALQCHFCGREGERGEGGETQFGMVQARHNPRLEHVVCGDCLKWNRITAA
jgi:hypothetical protein